MYAVPDRRNHVNENTCYEGGRGKGNVEGADESGDEAQRLKEELAWAAEEVAQTKRQLTELSVKGAQ